ncbi:dipeptidyl aminopeptidase [Punctularia strigosozonata HHB-11173 SS5]|uniref:dipeptidyl aminopeptidase n=1 Tax=Punctularia strigosozonata (strain HHB-11173) TaxID=741275 RepID=UPI00044170B5|nr:dipeptidyl aminopeptidase [Punctularia strigosozonata HHB-11173 SS5]EIN06216.1 dipeptidyl aminopeptidase [Punctularia strigosozonata HHB-11173 SS5]
MAPSYHQLAEDDGDDLIVHGPGASTANGDVPVTATRATFQPQPGSSGRDYRPMTYYGEGPFDPPSSDEEDNTLLEKDSQKLPSSPRLERGDGLVVGSSRKRNASLKCLIVCLVILVFLAAGIGGLAAMSYTGTVYRVPGTQHITMDHIFNGTFGVDRQSLRWVPEAGDGVFAISQNNYIRLVDLKTNTTTNLVAMQNVRDARGNPLHYSEWKLSADMKYLLVKADALKQWRHSSFGNYYVHNLEDHSTWPLFPPSHPPTTAYATWSPTGESIAFVTGNDLYVVTSPSKFAEPIRVTGTGNASLFNGVPDWVYEEEVLSDDFALWFSPDSSKVAFLTSDETSVPEFSYTVFNPTENSNQVVPYTSEIVMKYPKPGYPNPLVSVNVFDIAAFGESGSAQQATLELDWDGRIEANNSIIQEVAWVADSSLIVKEVNRAATNGSVVYFDLDGNNSLRNRGEVVRKLGKDGEQGDEGWIDADQSIYPLPKSLSSDGAYLDIVPTSEGYNHIALFNPGSASKAIFLTSGEWEVTGGIQAIDVERKLIYFQAATPSIERHIYAVPIPDLNTVSSASSTSFKPVKPTELTDRAAPAWFSADFSPEGGFHLLSYEGPGVPWQSIRSANDSSFDYTLTTNERLNNTLAQYEAPIIIRSTIEVDGQELNVQEMRPPRMDDSGRTKYPVLFRVYGGPGSQMVDSRFSRDWHTFLACAMDYIVVTVDGRGTGYKGRKFRNWVKGDLGFWETKDQVGAAKVWAAKEYVDPRRIGIWGWSYGGFMSSKVIEADAGVHSLAMAVAPVTSWLLYDSIYTERYMGLPAENPAGYVNASISNVTAFHAADFLLAHGSGDDNVHYANSAHLLDMFTGAHVRNFRFRMFTDSDHSISRRGAYREVFEFLTEFLLEKWGSGGRRRTW